MKLEGLQIAYYGDDFTGSTDVLEVLAANGLSTVLFLRKPHPDWMRPFQGCQAVGLAGVARSQTPEWMDRELPGIFEWLGSLGAKICHYKVCSTFDSSPKTGSIGRAIDLAQNAFRPAFVPVVVGMPALRRFVVFGNLFASVGDSTYRIDRHPVMSRHPVTPMDEGDLRLHLGKQTSKRIALVDILALRSEETDAAFGRVIDSGAEIVLFDSLDAESLEQVGRLVWGSGVPFAAGSSGVEYALVAHWRESGLLPEPPRFAGAGAVDRIAVLSGSCSAVTEVQIDWARDRGYALVPLNAAALAGGDGRDAEMEQAAATACGELWQGRSVILSSAVRPSDSVALDTAGRESLARFSGVVMDRVLAATGLRRAVVAGGDTSGHAGRELGIYALTFLTPIAPGAPLCRAHAVDPQRDGMEIVFKGGQCGGEEFFEQVRKGER